MPVWSGLPVSTGFPLLSGLLPCPGLFERASLPWWRALLATQAPMPCWPLVGGWPLQSSTTVRIDSLNCWMAPLWTPTMTAPVAPAASTATVRPVAVLVASAATRPEMNLDSGPLLVPSFR